MMLGDKLGEALATVGITEERVAAWLGRPCNCKKRKEKLNALGMWAARVLTGKKDDAVEQLDKIMKE